MEPFQHAVEVTMVDEQGMKTRKFEQKRRMSFQFDYTAA
jgi:hypothetical protein